MARIPTPLRWRRRTIAVLVDPGMARKYDGRAVRALVAGPFAIYAAYRHWGHTLMHLPTQVKLIEARGQKLCRDAAERFAALDLNWWTCTPEEVTGPDLEGMRTLYDELRSWPLVEVPFRR